MALEEVSALKHHVYRVVLLLRRGRRPHHGLHDPRVEVLAGGVEHLQAGVLQCSQHLALDHVDALHDVLHGGGGRVQKGDPLQVVDRIHQTAHQIRLGSRPGFPLLPAHPLAVVLELRSEAQVAVVQVDDFALELRPGPLGLSGGRRVGRCMVRGASRRIARGPGNIPGNILFRGGTSRIVPRGFRVAPVFGGSLGAGVGIRIFVAASGVRVHLVRLGG